MGMSPLFDAITEERWPAIRLLLARGADINLPDNMHMTPAIYASYLNKYEIVYQLIEQGTDINVYDDIGASLAWNVSFSEANIYEKSPVRPWLLKVKLKLEQRGITFPSLSPQQVRELRKAGADL